MAKVKVSQGWLEGELLDMVTGDGKYYSFKGIPYAAPPVSKLRFKAPKPPLPWDGIRKATSHGPNCPQLDFFTREIAPNNEDCLYLNVYTKNINPKSPLPVMIFIHGGAFKSGSGDVNLYGPDFLVDHDVVLVTLNYRVEALGFLCLDTEDVPGNAGLKDQTAAMRWVKENISGFGGDANNVTIFGESSGGASVTHHLLSPLSKGLFQKAISMSGVSLCDWVVSYKPRERAFVLGKLLGFETEDPKQLLDFLQSLPVEKLIDTEPVLIGNEAVTNNVVKLYHFTPVVEKELGQEHFLTEDPLKALKNGRVNEADLFIGHTDEEALFSLDAMKPLMPAYNRYKEMMVPRDLLIKCNPDTVWEASNSIRERYFGKKLVSEESMREYTNYISDTCFIFPLYRFLNHLPKIGNSKVFMYKFTCVSERNFFGVRGKQYGITGAAHLDDILYLFDPKEYFTMKLDKNSKEYKLIKMVNTVFTNFAKFGTPTPDQSLGVTCPQYSTSRRELLNIGNQLTVETHSTEIFDFWKSIFDSAGVEF